MSGTLIPIGGTTDSTSVNLKISSSAPLDANTIVTIKDNGVSAGQAIRETPDRFTFSAVSLVVGSHEFTSEITLNNVIVASSTYPIIVVAPPQIVPIPVITGITDFYFGTEFRVDKPDLRRNYGLQPSNARFLVYVVLEDTEPTGSYTIADQSGVVIDFGPNSTISHTLGTATYMMFDSEQTTWGKTPQEESYSGTELQLLFNGAIVTTSLVPF